MGKWSSDALMIAAEFGKLGEEHEDLFKNPGSGLLLPRASSDRFRHRRP